MMKVGSMGILSCVFILYIVETQTSRRECLAILTTLTHFFQEKKKERKKEMRDLE